MKRLTLLLPVLAIVMAIGAAFAMKSSNEMVPTQVWYRATEGNPSSACLPITLELEPCNTTSPNDCIKDIDPGTPIVERTLFRANDCEQPYQMP